MIGSRILQRVKSNYRSTLCVITALIVSISTTTFAYAAPTFSSHALSSGYANPGQTTTAGGALWYMETIGGNPSYYIGRMTTAGVTTDYNIRTLSGNSSFILHSLTTGPDGNVWFNGMNGTSVYTGYINISTGTVTIYGDPVPSYSGIGNLVPGSDGNLWYSVKSAWAQNYTYLIDINPSSGMGGTIGETLGAYVNITSLTNGPDGKLWYTDSYYNRVTSFAVGGGSGGASYTIPTTNSYPSNITAGPDGSLWFRESVNGKITKITTSGTFTEYSTGVSPVSILAGPDGALWFTDASTTQKIGRITTAGIVTEYTIPGAGVSGLSGLMLGPDNAMWFGYTDSNGANLGSITTAPTFSNYAISSSYVSPGSTTTAGGALWYLENTTNNPSYTIGKMSTLGVVTDYNIRTLSGNSGIYLTSLTTGPDGNVWFVGKNGSTLYSGYLNISTGTVTLYAGPVPVYSNVSNIVTGSDGNLWYSVKSAWAQNYSYLVSTNPSTGTSVIGATFDAYANITSLTSGPDGKLWYTDSYYNRVISFPVGSGSGNASYVIPTANSSPSNIISGPDGNLWFREGASGKITKLTTGGTFTEYTPLSGIYPSGLVAGSDGAVWFVDNGGSNKVGRITSTGVITEYVIPGTSVSITGGTALGPDGAIWFGYKSSTGGNLGRLGY